MTGRRFADAASHAALTLAAVVVLLPFVWIASAAFKTQISLLTGQFWFKPVWSNFQEVLFSMTSDYLHDFMNSMIIGLCSTALVLVVATLAAYSIARLRWPGWVVHTLLLWAAVFNMIPPITMVGAWYVLFHTIGLDNTYLGLILGHATLNLPLSLWLMTVFVREVPTEIEEAARLDGCSTPRLIARIIVPLVRPGLTAAGLLAFIFSWNEFAVALNLTQKATATVPVAIAKYAQEFDIRYTAMAAGALLSAVPAIVLLLVGQRHIVKGLTAGALK
jgi:multiple sugar transport system permease protein